MISDVLSQAAYEIERYLNDAAFGYKGRQRVQIVALLSHINEVRSLLDAPPCTDADRSDAGPPAEPKYQCDVCTAKGPYDNLCPFEHYPQGRFVRPVNG